MSSVCAEWGFLGFSFRSFSPAECAGIAFWFQFRFPLGCSGVGQFALPIPPSLFSFFCTRKQHETVSGSSTCHVPLKLPSIYSQLPLLCVPVTIRHGQKEQGKCDDVVDESRLQLNSVPLACFAACGQSA